MAETKFYVDDQGVYLGGFSEGNPSIPAGAIEVPSPPDQADKTWDGSSFGVSKDVIKACLAKYRWEKEVGGINFGGVPIRTDERSRSLLSGIQRKIAKENNGSITRKVKTEAGFIVIDNNTMEALYDFVCDHVQLCFDIEEDLIGQIDSGTILDCPAMEAEFELQYAAG